MCFTLMESFSATVVGSKPGNVSLRKTRRAQKLKEVVTLCTQKQDETDRVDPVGFNSGFELRNPCVCLCDRWCEGKTHHSTHWDCRGSGRRGSAELVPVEVHTVHTQRNEILLSTRLSPRLVMCSTDHRPMVTSAQVRPPSSPNIRFEKKTFVGHETLACWEKFISCSLNPFFTPSGDISSSHL